MVPSDYTDEQIADAIEACGGYMSGIAKMLQVGQGSLGQYIRKRAELYDRLLDQREVMLDNAEQAIAKAVHAEKAWAVKFALSRLGRNRGYGQKIDVQATVDGDSRVVIYLPDDGREAKATDGDTTTAGATGHCSTLPG
jgi:topoisomerase IA-like protein